jgi:serine/threonine protein phosphatase PrpC
MNTAILRGRDHENIGAIAATAEGTAAVSLSRGGAKKRYAYKDPNEDDVAFAIGAGGTFLAVADGHGGGGGSEAALAVLLAEFAPRWTSERPPSFPATGWQEEALAAFESAQGAIVARAVDDGTDAVRTTLAFALVRPGDDLFAWGSFGDSHIFHQGGSAAEVVDLGAREAGDLVFLGWPGDTRESLAGKCLWGSEALADTRAVVLVTDGISERGIGVDDPEATVAEVVERASAQPWDLRALELARCVAEEALAAHVRQSAGDNIGVACFYP